jgi:hypothetical protein
MAVSFSSGAQGNNYMVAAAMPEGAMFVISCHPDTCFWEHRLERRANGTVFGQLDNFAGVHAVMLAYFSGRLPVAGVRIELTHGEEQGCLGAYEVMKTLDEEDVVLVVDVTGTPTDKDFVIEKCSHSGLREQIQRALARMSYELHEGCPDPVVGIDETDIYRRKCARTCFLGVPVSGGDYNREPVWCRERSLHALAEALCRIAQLWPAEYSA